MGKTEKGKSRLRRPVWTLLALVILPFPASGIWYERQTRRQHLDRALIEALKSNHTSSALALLKEGADANAVDKPDTPITLKSVLADFWNRLKSSSPPETEHYAPALLLLYPDPLQNDLDFSRFEDRSELVKALLEHGADPYAADEEGDTLLHAAVSIKHRGTVKELLEHQLPPNVKDRAGATPLMGAEEDCARLLIAHGADVNAHNNSGLTPLMYCYSLQTCQMLLDHRADVNAQDNDGKTALIHAVQNSGFKEVPPDHWAYPSVPPFVSNQVEPIRIPLTLPRFEFSRFLESAQSPTFESAEAKARFLLRRGAKVSIKDQEGKSALDYVHGNGNRDLLRLLEEAAGKERDQKDERR